jgi:hypothetical protein
MAKDNNFLLRQRFLYVIKNFWEENNHQLKDISCVYAILSIDYSQTEMDIEYIGSTTKLFSRYKSHKVPEKVQATGKINILYYLPMNKGFYDYEIKLIKKLKPIFNKQHKL